MARSEHNRESIIFAVLVAAITIIGAAFWSQLTVADRLEAEFRRALPAQVTRKSQVEAYLATQGMSGEVLQYAGSAFRPGTELLVLHRSVWSVRKIYITFTFDAGDASANLIGIDANCDGFTEE